MTSLSNCVFCNITSYRDRDAKIWYVDNDIMVIRNRLTWVPIMLLVMPKLHLSQYDLWGDGFVTDRPDRKNTLLSRMGDIAVELGLAFAPEGFRVLSNFGRHGLQSQSHGHLHVVGGVQLQEYA